jgi:hypothetical protein
MLAFPARARPFAEFSALGIMLQSIVLGNIHVRKRMKVRE